MKLCRIIDDQGRSRLGLYHDDYVVPATIAHEVYRQAGYGASPLFPPPGDNALDWLPPNWANYALMDALATIAEQVGDEDEMIIPIDEVYFDIPTPMPNKVICLAGNYSEHIREGGGQVAEKARTFPFFFMKPPTTTIRASGSGVATPATSPDFIDWEVELVVVMGAYTKDVTPEEARKMIAGYTVGLDMSNRRLRLNPDRAEQERTAFHEWLCGKWHDGFAPVGPCIVPADDDFDPMDCRISLSVNGELMQDSNTGAMVFDVYELVSHASRIMTLEPGDMIMTGTPSGVGAARDRYLRPNDLLEATIEGIGTLEVSIV